MFFDSNKREGSCFTALLGLILVTIAAILNFVTTTKYIPHNKLDDEPKILEMANQRFSKESGGYRNSFEEVRSKVINEFYSTKTETAPRMAQGILLVIAGFFWVFTLIGAFEYYYEESDLGIYFRARAEYWKNRATKENKVLVELIELQRKISNVND